jgi:hypothetical protein
LIVDRAPSFEITDRHVVSLHTAIDRRAFRQDNVNGPRTFATFITSPTWAGIAVATHGTRGHRNGYSSPMEIL